MDSVQVFKGAGGSYDKIQSIKYTFTPIYGDEIKAGQVHNSSTTYDERYGTTSQQYKYVEHRIRPGGLRLGKQEDIYYNSNGNIVTETVYEYGNVKHGYPTKITTTKSDGRTLVKTLKYPPESVNTGATDHRKAISEMISKNILRPVIEQTESYGSGMETTVTNLYNLTYTTPPYQWPVIQRVILRDSRNKNLEESRLEYNSYDSYTNPVDFTLDDKRTIYIWGYDRQHLVAVIENATSDQVTNALGENFRTVVINQANIDAKLHQLRTSKHLVDAHITTFKYKPLIGVIEVTEPSGAKTSYDYDAAGRLTEVKDTKGYKVQDYLYNLK